MFDLQKLAGSSAMRIFKKDEVMLTEGDNNSDELFIILSGNANVLKNYGAKNICLARVSAGQMVGEMGLFCSAPRSNTVVATEDVIALSVSSASYNALAAASPDTAFQISQILCARLEAANKAISTLTRRLATQKADTANAPTAKSAPAPVQTANLTSFVGSKLLAVPEGHGQYPVVEPATYQNYITRIEKTCPVCNATIEIPHQLVSKQKPARAMGSDFRKHIVDFDPLWYNVCTCPKCYFSMLEDAFNNPDLITRGDIDTKLKNLRAEITLDFNSNKTLDMVFATYYIALACVPYYVNFKHLTARLWLELSWLYDDAKDSAMHAYAKDYALAAYKKMYDECNMSVDSEQTTCLILGTLCAEMGQDDDALRYFYSAKTIRGGKPVYTKMAEDGIYDVREAMRAKKQGEK